MKDSLGEKKNQKEFYYRSLSGPEDERQPHGHRRDSYMKGFFGEQMNQGELCYRFCTGPRVIGSRTTTGVIRI